MCLAIHSILCCLPAGILFASTPTMELALERMAIFTRRRLSRPSTAVIIMVFLFAVQVVTFSQSVIADNTAAAASESALNSIAQIIGIATSIGIFVMFLAGLWWFVWKGKNIEDITNRNTELKDENDDLRTQKAELAAGKVKKNARIRKLRLARIRDRKLIHRLLAKIEGLDLDGLDDDEKLLILNGDDDEDEDDDEL